jgi:hypothetical protein
MTKNNQGQPSRPLWPGMHAQLETLEMSLSELVRAKLNLQRAQQVLDLDFALAAGLKRLFDVAIVGPVRYLRRRRGAGWRLSSAAGSGHGDFQDS